MHIAECSPPETTKFNYLCDSDVFCPCLDNHKDSHNIFFDLCMKSISFRVMFYVVLEIILIPQTIAKSFQWKEATGQFKWKTAYLKAVWLFTSEDIWRNPCVFCSAT